MVSEHLFKNFYSMQIKMTLVEEYICTDLKKKTKQFPYVFYLMWYFFSNSSERYFKQLNLYVTAVALFSDHVQMLFGLWKKPYDRECIIVKIKDVFVQNYHFGFAELFWER